MGIASYPWHAAGPRVEGRQKKEKDMGEGGEESKEVNSIRTGRRVLRTGADGSPFRGERERSGKETRGGTRLFWGERFRSTKLFTNEPKLGEKGGKGR